MAGSAKHPEEVLYDLNPEDNRGGWETGPRRVLHPSASIGFHAPYIDYGDRLEIPVQEAAQGMHGALALTGYLLSTVKENFPIELAMETLAKGPSEFYPLDEVGQLSSWAIDLETDFHPALSLDLFKRAWSVAAHQFSYFDGGYGSWGDTAFGLKREPAPLDSASGWADSQRGTTESGAPYLIAANVGREASFGAVFIDYGSVFQLRVLSSDFSEEYARFELQGWQLLQPETKINTLGN